MFAPERLEALARQSNFVQRASSKLTGQDFFALMTTEMLDDPAVSLGGLCDILRQRNPQAVMTPQALHQRLNTPQAVTYMQEAFQLALRTQLEPLYAQLPAALLASFSRVFLEDSPQCCLHEKLAEAFQGSGGSASRSTVKIDVIYELLHHQLHDIVVTDGRAADQGLAAAIVPHLRAGDLVIRDLGYFSLEALHQIVTKQAGFLSRLSNSVTVYPSAEATVPALSLVDHVQRHMAQQAVVDLAVYVGHLRLPSRVLAYRLPEEVVEQRRRSAYETARKKGRTPTQAYLHWLQFGWYLTNVGVEIWAPAVVATVYRIRWHVELFQSHDIKCRRDAFFFLVGGHGLRFTGQDVMDCKRPIPRHPHCFSQPLDHGVPVFATPAVPMTAEQGAEGRASAGAMFPLHGRVTLRCDRGAFLRECLEPWRDLLPPGRQLLQGAPLRVRGVDAPRSLSLSMVSVEVHTRSVVLQLALLPLLDVLPQRVGLPHGLGMVPQVASQGPHERSASVGAPTPRWAAWRTARGAGILPGTLLIQRGGALPHAPWPCGRPRSLTRPTAHARPQPRALRGRRRRPARLFVMALPRRVRFPTDGGTNACGRRDRPPRLGRTTRTGRVRLPRVACAPGCLAWAPRCGLILRAVSGVEHLGKQAAHAGRMPSVISARTRRERRRVEPLHEVARGPLCMAHPAT